MTAAGPTIQNGSVLLRDGKIVAVGANLAAPSDAIVVDGTGNNVTPGLIDTHSHLGVYPAPGTSGNNDGNEATSPVTAHVWAEHSVWPQDLSSRATCLAASRRLQVLLVPRISSAVRAPWVRPVPAPFRTVSRAPSTAEDGVRRESQTRVRQSRSFDAHGQRRRYRAAGSAPRRIGGAGTSGTPTSRAIRRRATSTTRRLPRCAATSWCTTTAIAPTRWRR